MSERVMLQLEGPEITLRHVEQAAKEFGNIVGEVTNEFAHAGRDVVRWVVSHAHAGSFELAATAVPAKPAISEAMLPNITASVVRGMAIIQERAERPPFLVMV